MDNISLSFSQEEVVLVLKLLGAESIPGVGQQPFGEVSEDVERHLLASAERTLRARAMISIEDDRINIDQVVVALIGTCAVPQYSWLVTRVLQEQPPENRFYHVSPSMFIEHTISGPGIHTFTALARQAQMVERLTQFWQLHSQDVEQQSQIVQTEEMQRLLTQLMLSQPTEGAMDSPLSEPVIAINTIALIDHTENEGDTPPPTSFVGLQPSTDITGVTSTSYVQCQDTLWQTRRLDNAQIELTPVSPTVVGKQIDQWQKIRLDAQQN